MTTTTTTTATTYVLRQLDWNGNPVGLDNSYRVEYYSLEGAKRMVSYIYRKYDEIYAIQGSDGTLVNPWSGHRHR
jgi:hypothetical protein